MSEATTLPVFNHCTEFPLQNVRSVLHSSDGTQNKSGKVAVKGDGFTMV